MTTPTEALKLALPALMESLRRCLRRHGEVGTRDVDVTEWNANVSAAIAAAGGALAALAQAEQAQPAREPFITNDMVASALDAISKRHEIRPTVHTMAEALHAALLAAPPAAQPLTDADIEAVMGPCEGSAFAEHLRREFVKSFKRVYFKLHPERAHGIGQPPEARFGYMAGDVEQKP